MQAITNGLIRLGGYDLTGDSNKIASSYGVQALDNTVLGQKTKTNQGGLKTTKFSAAGFWDSVNDAPIFADISLTDILTWGFTSTEGGIIFFQKGMQAQYRPFNDAVGKLASYDLTADAAGDLVRGYLVANKTAIAATGFGTGFNIGAVSASQSVYSALHVTSVGGTTPDLTVIVQSSPDNTFASPTTRITFAGATAVGAQLLSDAGAITDSWWRVGYTLTGTSPLYNFTASIGIQ